jgi:glucose/arabinose dehydrogenase/PKD repeat protein
MTAAIRRLLRGAVAATVAATCLALPPLAAAQSTPPPDSAFEKVTLNDLPGEPMDLAVLPDGRVLHTTRPGELWLHNPATGRNTLAATFNVYRHDEEGLQSVALDPNFSENHWVYVYYSPPLNTPVDDPVTPVNEGDAPFFGTPADFNRYKGAIRLSRFRLTGAKLNMGSEQQILDVPVDRGICCHVGGDILFDRAGNLILSTGDDTNPFESDGYTPIDERPGRNPAFDAQRSAANTNDLRGKILRIRPGQRGGYSIPAGNLFPLGTAKTRPEIYAMGFRNPFRIEINRGNDDIYVGDYSPDNRNANPLRGPAGQGKWTILREPGNYGWPYCATAQLPYVDYDFATGVSSATFNCASPVNESPHNTGLTQLPPVTQPDVWYSYTLSAEFPQLGSTPPGGIGPMGGPAYDFDPAKASPPAWPAYFDGAPLFYEWTRDYIKEFRLNAAGDVAQINPVLPTLASPTVDNGMDLEFGPDGALYTLEYGDGFFSENPDAQLARIDYIGPGGNHAPHVQVAANPTAGLPRLTVSFSSAGTSDPDGDQLSYAWYLDDNDDVDSTAPNPTFTYKKEGVYQATLKVTDEHGRSASSYVEITVGNQPPVVDLTTTPAPGQPFTFGQSVTYSVNVTDEDPIDCSRAQVFYIVGHDTHGHPQSTTAGCTGTIQTTIPSGHDPADITAVFVAEYTDAGGLIGRDQVVLGQTG